MLRRGITATTNIARYTGVQRRVLTPTYSRNVRGNNRSALLLLPTNSLTTVQMFSRRLLPLNVTTSTSVLPMQQMCHSSTLSKRQTSSEDLGNNAEATRAMNVVEGDAMGMPLHATDRAIKRIKYVLEEEPAEAALRVAVDSGGCHGYQYRLELTHSIDKSEDIVFDCDGARIVVDNISLPLLAGAQIDFVTELIGSAFKVVSNPNASSTCGCDVSFEIK